MYCWEFTLPFVTVEVPTPSLVILPQIIRLIFGVGRVPMQHGKAAIPRFSMRIRMRISMRIRKISMRTPYSTFQYPSNVSDCVYLTINSAYIISLSFTWKCNVFLSKMWWTVFFLSYIRVIFQGYDVLGADYGFDI